MEADGTVKLPCLAARAGSSGSVSATRSFGWLDLGVGVFGVPLSPSTPLSAGFEHGAGSDEMIPARERPASGREAVVRVESAARCRFADLLTSSVLERSTT